MSLKRYLAFVQDILYSRKDLVVQNLFVQEIQPEQTAIVEARLHCWDGSVLSFVEHLVLRGAVLTRPRYAYHYQKGDGTLIFRYDNTAHHPELATYPHHKHVLISASQGEAVTAAAPPSLTEVLREIDDCLAGKR